MPWVRQTKYQLYYRMDAVNSCNIILLNWIADYMKSKIIIFFLIFIYILKANLLIRNLNIKSKKIKIDEKKVLQFFKIRFKPMTSQNYVSGIMVNLKKIKF